MQIEKSSSIAAKNDYDKIVITHGTDTMVKPQKTIKHEIPKPLYSQVPWIPYAFGNLSMDFSILGAALAFVQTLPHGMAMNGRYFHWDSVRKNTGYRIFQKMDRSDEMVF